jgi:hypothetical protein
MQVFAHDFTFDIPDATNGLGLQDPVFSGAINQIVSCVGSAAPSARTITLGDLIDPNGDHHTSSHEPLLLEPGECHRYYIGGPSTDFPGILTLTILGTYTLDVNYSGGDPTLTATFEVINPPNPSTTLDVSQDSTMPGTNAEITFCSGENDVHVVHAIIIDPAENDSHFSVPDGFDVPANTCITLDTDTDFPTLDTAIPGTYLVIFILGDQEHSIGFHKSFFVIPEFAIGGIAAVASSLAALGGYLAFKTRQKS